METLQHHRLVSVQNSRYVDASVLLERFRSWTERKQEGGKIRFEQDSRARLDKSTQTERGIVEFLEEVGLESYAQLFVQHFGVHTMEELLCAMMGVETMDNLDLGQFLTPSLPFPMLPVHAARFNRAIRTRLVRSSSSRTDQSNISSFEILSNPLVTSTPAPSSSSPRREIVDISPRIPQRNTSNSPVHTVNDSSESDGKTFEGDVVRISQRRANEASRIFNVRTFVALADDCVTKAKPDRNDGRDHDAASPVISDISTRSLPYWLGQIGEILPGDWYKVRLLVEASMSMSYIQTDFTLIAHISQLYSVQPHLQYDPDLHVWSSRDPRQPVHALLPGVPPTPVPLSFQVEAPANTSQFAAFVSLRFDMSVADFERDTRLELELHASLSRFLRQNIEIVNVYDGGEVTSSSGSGDGGGDGDESRRDTTAVDVVARVSACSDLVSASVREVFTDLERLVRSSAFFSFVMQSTGVAIIGISNARVIRIVTTSLGPRGGKERSSRSDGSETEERQAVRPGDFVAFENDAFAPISESVDRPEWWVGRVERRVWGENGLVVHLRWYKETSLGSGVYLPTNDWFVRTARTLRWIDISFDPSKLCWVAKKMNV